MSVLSRKFRVGTQATILALARAREMVDRFQQILPGWTFEVVSYSSPADRQRSIDRCKTPAAALTQDLDEALLSADIDMAVHRAGDLPETMPEGLDWMWLPAPQASRDEVQRHINEDIRQGEREYPALTFRTGDVRCLRLRSLFVKPVVFVGAGPAGQDLCTIAGVSVLAKCEVCMYDALVDGSVLDLVPSAAVRLSVGKRSGRHFVAQEEICRLLTLYARRGCRVVRLKGGDPGLFGRLAEETGALDSFSLPYRVIPGVSSLSAATTGTGLLLTRRGVSRAFTVLTPRSAESGFVSLSQTDTRKLPLVYFMAGNVISTVIDDLLQQGYPPELPIAIVRDAGLESQCVQTGTLASLRQRPATMSKPQPALVMVGPTASAAFLYNDTARGALKGMRVLITSSMALQDRLAAVVTEYGGIPVRRPLIRIDPDLAAVPTLNALPQFDWIILTSPASIHCLFRLLDQIGANLRILPKLMISGPGTLAELRNYRLVADAQTMAPYGPAELLRLAQSRFRASDYVLRCRSNRASDRITKTLRKIGIRVTDCVLYRHTPIHYDHKPEFEAVIFAGRSAVRSFVANWGASSLDKPLLAAIGRSTGTTIAEYGRQTTVIASETATPENVVEALSAWVVAADLAHTTNEKQERPTQPGSDAP